VTRQEVIKYFLSKPGAWEDYPFDDITPVLKVGKKMFALIRTESPPLQINLKCDPELSRDLREVYEDITPGYHMNKKHWNTVNIQGSLPEEEIKKLIDLSYDLVVKSLPKREREALQKK